MVWREGDRGMAKLASIISITLGLGPALFWWITMSEKHELLLCHSYSCSGWIWGGWIAAVGRLSAKGCKCSLLWPLHVRTRNEHLFFLVHKRVRFLGDMLRLLWCFVYQNERTLVLQRNWFPQIRENLTRKSVALGIKKSQKAWKFPVEMSLIRLR